MVFWATRCSRRPTSSCTRQRGPRGGGPGASRGADTGNRPALQPPLRGGLPRSGLLLTPTSKILGMDRRKMSKSYGNAIFLSETDKDIDQKVSQMITDPQRMRRADPGTRMSATSIPFTRSTRTRRSLHESTGSAGPLKSGASSARRSWPRGSKRRLHPSGKREKR